ncbi:hypothetical protein JL720_13129 [Aureococcus anophagefferens]|nr:hypothetical protein JL720_13129 [Aureococcus anophagefferens]
MYAKLGFRVAGATAGGALLATALGRDELKGSKLSLDARRTAARTRARTATAIDSIPIANGVIKAGGACEIKKYFYDQHDAFAMDIEQYDALIVRINPGQLSQIPGVEGVQAKYYDEATLDKEFRKTCAFQPRVIKQNRGSAGEGIWLCWLQGKPYCTNYGDASLGDNDKLKLIEMNDSHTEYHTVKEFLTFCVHGPDHPAAGTWTSTFPGQYLKGGVAAGGQLVDQRLLPRISEGEVRVLMSGDTCQMIIHKMPEGGGLSAVGGQAAYTFYKPEAVPEDPLYNDLLKKLLNDIDNGLMDVLGLKGEALPLLWTCDYIPKNPEGWSKPGNACAMDTEYVVGEFNCSCVGVSKFQAVCGGELTLADVSDADYFDGCELTDLMGKQAIKMLKATQKK